MIRLPTHLLLQLLQKSSGEGSICVDPTCRLNLNLPLCLFVFLLHSSYKAPQDIHPDSSVKAPKTNDDIPRAEDTPSPDTLKSESRAIKPQSLSGTKSSPNLAKAPSPQKASPSKVIPSSNPIENPQSSKLAESPQDHSTKPLISWTRFCWRSSYWW
jgi:hypothetical protein